MLTRSGSLSIIISVTAGHGGVHVPESDALLDAIVKFTVLEVMVLDLSSMAPDKQKKPGHRKGEPGKVQVFEETSLRVAARDNR